MAGGATVAVHAAHATVVAVGAGAVGALLVAPARQAAGSAARAADLRALAARGELVDAAVRRAAAGAGPAALRRPRSLEVAAVASVAAAAVHAAVAPEHLAGSLVAGAFFAVVAAGQVGWAVAVLRSPAARRLLVLGMVASLALVALWAASRSLGIPPALGGEGVEPVGAGDLLAVGCELAVAAAAARAWRRCR